MHPSAPSSIPKPIAEILQAFIAGILPAIQLMILCAAWIGVLVCLLLALIHFSTKSLRRRPLFILTVIAVCIGIICSVLEIVMVLRGTIDSVNTFPTDDRATLYTLVSLCGLSVLCTDSILLFRLAAVFPFDSTPWQRLFLIFGPLFMLKIGRLAITIVWLVAFITKMDTTQTTTEFYIIATELVEPKVLWGIQLLDNSVCSFLFLLRLHQGRSIAIRVCGEDGKASFPQRLQTLFWIAVSNFVFPLIFVIVQLVTFTDHTTDMLWLMINISDIGVEIIGVLFATLWSSSSSWFADLNSNRGNVLHSIQFASRQPDEALSFSLDMMHNSTNARSPAQDHSSGSPKEPERCHLELGGP